MQVNSKSAIMISIFGVIFLGSIFYIGYYAQNQPKKLNQNEIVIRMVARQFEYEPQNVTVPYGAKVTFILTSEDVIHGFHIDEYNIHDVQIQNGEETKVSFVADKRGSFIFYCDIFCGVGHSDHWGTLIVT